MNHSSKNLTLLSSKKMFIKQQKNFITQQKNVHNINALIENLAFSSLSEFLVCKEKEENSS